MEHGKVMFQIMTLLQNDCSRREKAAESWGWPLPSKCTGEGVILQMLAVAYVRTCSESSATQTLTN